MSHFGPAISHETANDPLFRMRAYRLASDLLKEAWKDAKALSAEPVTERLAGQLYAAVTSIGAALAKIALGFLNTLSVPCGRVSPGIRVLGPF
jgi:hypothetical protein